VEALVRNTFREATGMDQSGNTVMHVKPADPKLPSVEDLLKLAKKDVPHYKLPIRHSRVMVFWLLPTGLYDKESPVASIATSLLDAAVQNGIFNDEMQGAANVAGTEMGRFRNCY